VPAQLGPAVWSENFDPRFSQLCSNKCELAAPKPLLGYRAAAQPSASTNLSATCGAENLSLTARGREYSQYKRQFRNTTAAIKSLIPLKMLISLQTAARQRGLTGYRTTDGKAASSAHNPPPELPQRLFNAAEAFYYAAILCSLAFDAENIDSGAYRHASSAAQAALTGSTKINDLGAPPVVNSVSPLSFISSCFVSWPTGRRCRATTCRSWFSSWRRSRRT
jgi:hypothetical protein